MNFKQFQRINAGRCNTRFRPIESWSPSIWALAIAGEAGELCNVLKKVERGDFTIEDVKEDIAAEIADVMTYCDLLYSRLNLSTEDELIRKFNIVSKRVGYPEWKQIK